jgi:hypothetical protein
MFAGGHGGGRGGRDAAVGADQDAGTNFGHEASCEVDRECWSFYQIPGPHQIPGPTAVVLQTGGGGAIQLAGEVKARGERRRVRSDWMAVERERGISVSSAVMSFEHGGLAFNLLDTPGHQDFSEDTYRTLTAVDSAAMVLDAAKGIEEQTRKLFEVCRLRDVPIITFVNKLDREARDPFAAERCAGRLG